MKALRNFLLFLGLFSIILCCSCLDFLFDPDGDDDQQQTNEDLIYATVINGFENSTRQTYVIYDSTVSTDLSLMTEYLKENFSGIEDETIQHFIDSNKKSYKINEIIGLKMNYILIPRERLYDWKTYYPEANSLIELSKVGFNSEGNQALLYLAKIWGPLAATGTIYYLQKSDQWAVKQSILLWIS